MTQLELAGLPLDEAMQALSAEGIQAEVVCAMPLGRDYSSDKRTMRVVRLRGHQLLVSLFKDGAPEDSK